MKVGKLAKILAVEIICPDPDCGGVCDDEDRGSSMIEDFVEVVVCEVCGTRCKVPKSAFKVKGEKA